METLPEPFPCGSLPTEPACGQHGTWTSWLWEATRAACQGLGGPAAPRWCWETGEGPSAHLQLWIDPSCMECAGVWESCLCHDIGWDMPSPPFPAHPGWLGAPGEVPLHPNNTQASHGRKFSIGLFQGRSFFPPGGPAPSSLEACGGRGEAVLNLGCSGESCQLPACTSLLTQCCGMLQLHFPFSMECPWDAESLQPLGAGLRIHTPRPGASLGTGMPMFP